MVPCWTCNTLELRSSPGSHFAIAIQSLAPTIVCSAHRYNVRQLKIDTLLSMLCTAETTFELIWIQFQLPMIVWFCKQGNRRLETLPPVCNPQCVVADLYRTANCGCNRCSSFGRLGILIHISIRLTHTRAHCVKTCDVIHKNITYRNAVRAGLSNGHGNVHRKLLKFCRVVSAWDTRSDRQTDNEAYSS